MGILLFYLLRLEPFTLLHRQLQVKTRNEDHNESVGSVMRCTEGFPNFSASVIGLCSGFGNFKFALNDNFSYNCDILKYFV